MDVMAEAEAERGELVAFLETLTPEQWDAPSLCEKWRVRDVVAHVVSYEGLGGAALVKRMLKGRLTFAGTNAAGVRELASQEPAELIQALRDHPRPTGLTSVRGGGVGLVDGMIHHQDIRRPLGAPREIPTERLAYALPFALTAPPIRGFWQGRGVRLVATDLDWSTGRGPEARGPAEAVLMVLAGRRGVAQDLTGPGRDVLMNRLDG